MGCASEHREQQALREAGVTTFAPGAKALLCAALFATIATGMLTQLVHDARDRPGAWPRTLDPRPLLPVAEEIRAVGGDDGWPAALALANRRVRANIAAYETTLEDSSPLVDRLVPAVNLLITEWLGGATESVYPGRGGWLFFRPDVEYVTSPGFLEAAGATDRQADPLPAIVELRDGLWRRGVELLVVIAPVKPTIYPDRYTRRHPASSAPLQNASFATFTRRLDAAGVHYVDLAGALATERSNAPEPLYLRTDTHWTPRGMGVAARTIAGAVRDLELAWDRPEEGFTESAVEVTNEGDTLRLLRLPAASAASRRERVVVRPIAMASGRPWAPDNGAEILLLGDSFANIFSLPSLGWGSAAGLGEHLSAHLGRTLDTLIINDNGSWTTRASLAGQLRRGTDRLAGKKLVVWEFASRELAFGDWRTGLRFE